MEYKLEFIDRKIYEIYFFKIYDFKKINSYLNHFILKFIYY